MRHELSRRAFVGQTVGLAAASLAATGGNALAATTPPVATFENEHLRLSFAADGQVLEFTDKASGKNHVRASAKAPIATVIQSGKSFPVTSIAKTERGLAMTFGTSGVRAVAKVTARPKHLVFEIESLDGAAEAVTFGHVPLTLAGKPDEPFAACALALNIQTRVGDLPGATSLLAATAYARFGIPGAKVAIIGCPQDQLRRAMQEAVAAAPELPHSPLGGPWALDAPINRGSYLFNFDGVTAKTADEWIALAKSLGMTQIDFHTGSSLRFGDCRPNPKRYPRGYADVKAAIDKLHAAGIQVGLHTYAFFIAQSCSWVSPAPDARLGKNATFTLSAALSTNAAVVPVDETTEKMSEFTGGAVRNGVTLQIDDELIRYAGVCKKAPFGFTGCQRGAWGTKVCAHAKGAKVHHLTECFGLFAPDGNSTLLTEVAAKTAEAYNECGFDMIYLDALDGSDVLGGLADSWHYSAKFTYEVWKRLKRPALVEMSEFHHLLWCVRSRYQAWDHPVRGHKKFIDMHCAQNEANRRIFLPGEFGWWALSRWEGAQTEPTYADDIEYLMAKCLGSDAGLALMGILPENVTKFPALPRLANIIKRYENLRHSGKVSESIKAKLRAPGDEYTLEGDLQSGWRFQADPLRQASRRRSRGPEQPLDDGKPVRHAAATASD